MNAHRKTDIYRALVAAGAPTGVASRAAFALINWCGEASVAKLHELPAGDMYRLANVGYVTRDWMARVWDCPALKPDPQWGWQADALSENAIDRALVSCA